MEEVDDPDELDADELCQLVPGGCEMCTHGNHDHCWFTTIYGSATAGAAWVEPVVQGCDDAPSDTGLNDTGN